MNSQLEHKFAIKAVSKTTDADYLKALKIYVDTTPFEIRTDSNEITYWLDNQTFDTPFELNGFILFLNNEIIGFSMLTYIKRTKVVIDEYLAVLEQYRNQTVFLVYQSLVENFYRENEIEISFYITEISNKGSGIEMDRESRIALKILCLKEYGKVDALYYALPLGLDNHESNFQAFLYLKEDTEQTKSLNRRTYHDIIYSMYYDYWYTWYLGVLDPSKIEEYKNIIDKYWELIKENLEEGTDSLSIEYSHCSQIDNYVKDYARPIPAQKIKKNYSWWIIVLVFLIMPIPLLFLYSKTLEVLNVSSTIMNSDLLGTILTLTISAFTAFIIARKTDN